MLSQTIATPKKPLPMLLEDSASRFCAIWFTAQLSFGMSLALILAAKDDRVWYMLQYKVARDSIGNAIGEKLANVGNTSS